MDHQAIAILLLVSPSPPLPLSLSQLGGAPITFVQNLLGHESLTTTGIYTQLVDQMAKEIALNTRTAIDEIEVTEETKLLKEARDLYEAEFAVVLPLVPGPCT